MCDVQAILAQGQCLSCLPAGQLKILGLIILCQILQESGGGGGESEQQVWTSPAVPPTAGELDNNQIANLWFNTASPVIPPHDLCQWDTDSQEWIC